MTTISLSTNPKYDDSRIVVRQILRLGYAIKRDISRITKYQSQEHSEKIHDLIMRCKSRILSRLSELETIRNRKKINDEEQWNKILLEAFSRVYRNSSIPEVYSKVQLLLDIDKTDTSRTGVHFLQMYMQIIARIPEEKIILPFKP